MKKIIFLMKRLLLPQQNLLNDFLFFSPLGILIALAIFIQDKISPESQATFFTALLNDHLPLKTISLLFILISSLFLFLFSLKGISKTGYFILKNLTVRMHSFLVPVMFIIFGFIIFLFITGSYIPVHMRSAKALLFSLIWPYLFIVTGNCATYFYLNRSLIRRKDNKLFISNKRRLVGVSFSLLVLIVLTIILIIN